MLETLKANWRTLSPHVIDTLEQLCDLNDLLPEDELYDTLTPDEMHGDSDYAEEREKERVPCSVCTVVSTNTTNVTFISEPTNYLSMQVGTPGGIYCAGYSFQELCQDCSSSFIGQSSHRKHLRACAVQAISHLQTSREQYAREIHTLNQVLFRKGITTQHGLSRAIVSFL